VTRKAGWIFKPYMTCGWLNWLRQSTSAQPTALAKRTQFI